MLKRLRELLNESRERFLYNRAIIAYSSDFVNPNFKANLGDILRTNNKVMWFFLVIQHNFRQSSQNYIQQFFVHFETSQPYSPK